MQYNRPKVVDLQFSQRVQSDMLPAVDRFSGFSTSGADLLSRAEFCDLFETQMLSRHLDLMVRELRVLGKAFYTIGSSGHEGNAVFGKAFRYTDMAFLHYRSCPHVIQRMKQIPGGTPLYDNMLAMVASSLDPIAGGRHKVFGSVPLHIPPQTSTIASHLPKAVGFAFSVDRAKLLKLPSLLPRDAIAICSFGDASINHSTSVGAINAAQWLAHQDVPVPVLFICEDNGIGISVPTPNHWVATAFGQLPHVKYFSANGKNLFDAYEVALAAGEYVRTTRKPALLHLETVRLFGHAGSDIETTYHSIPEIEAVEVHDPLLYTAALARAFDYLTTANILEMYEGIRSRLARVAEEAHGRPKLSNAAEVMAPIAPSRNKPLPLWTAEREDAFVRARKSIAPDDKKRHLAKLLNLGLAEVMARYDNAVIFGEDVAKKGGVYSVTGDLQKLYGRRRVFDTLLDEQTVLGTAIGMAHNGFLPIPEIQFLAYVHNAEDQLRSEASTLSFFSNGQYQNPMIVRIASLAYQRGFGGHFHNDNSIAVFRDIPGLIIACPSNGRDAVGMLRTVSEAAERDGRVVVFLEPIALYMTRDLMEKGDDLWAHAYPEREFSVPLGQCAVYGEGRDLAIITYGNGYYLSRQAEVELRERHKIRIRIIDLRWIAPLDLPALAELVDGFDDVLIVEECRRTGSLSEGIITGLVEHCKRLPRCITRIAAEDSFIPLGDAANFVLPSKDSIVRRVLELLKRKA